MRPCSGTQLELALGGPPASRHNESTDRTTLDIHRKRLGAALGMLLDDTVEVVLTENRSTMVSYGFTGGRLVVRLHRMFRHAVGRDIAALAAYISGRKGESNDAIDAFIERHRSEVGARAASTRRAVRRTRGDSHDLAQMLGRVRRRYFGGLGEVEITWGRAARKRPKRNSRTRSRALATYCYDDKTIRVNSVLDSPRVPDYVLEWVIYHELLHHVLPVEESAGRRRYHTRRFKALERGFEKYEEAVAWEKANLDWLLR